MFFTLIEGLRVFTFFYVLKLALKKAGEYFIHFI